MLAGYAPRLKNEIGGEHVMHETKGGGDTTVSPQTTQGRFDLCVQQMCPCPIHDHILFEDKNLINMEYPEHGNYSGPQSCNIKL